MLDMAPFLQENSRLGKQFIALQIVMGYLFLCSLIAMEFVLHSPVRRLNNIIQQIIIIVVIHRA